MFPYTDPSGTGLLARHGALDEWRLRLHEEYVEQSRLRNSAFAPLDAVVQAPSRRTATVDWLAFPKTAAGTDAEIDQHRSRQDEYVEWRVERDAAGRVIRVTFTTEFFEWYTAMAAAGAAAVQSSITAVFPGSTPAVTDLFGGGFNPAAATPSDRADRFVQNLSHNPWNNGSRGLLCLSNSVNSIPALFRLVGPCAVPREGVPASEVCSLLGNGCVPTRNSDPFICTSAQTIARGGEGLSIADPAGIRIMRLEGIWKIDGAEIDINDPAENQGAWGLSRNGRRGVLDLAAAVTIDDQAITSGTQVSRLLRVAADVVVAPEQELPTWARRGRESSRQIG